MNTDRARRKLEAFYEITRRLADLSMCKRDKTAAIVFPGDFSAIWAIGYNGPARGLDNDFCTGESGRCGCAHAEANAVGKLQQHGQLGIMLATKAPCVACANAVINCSKIDLVFWGEPHRDTAGLRHLKRAGISVFQARPAVPGSIETAARRIQGR